VGPRDVAAHLFLHQSRTSSVRQRLDAALRPLQMRTLMKVDKVSTVMGIVRDWAPIGSCDRKTDATAPQ
jgi:hypothetical protein